MTILLRNNIMMFLHKAMLLANTIICIYIYIHTHFTHISGGPSHFGGTVGCYPAHKHTSDMCHAGSFFHHGSTSNAMLPSGLSATALPGWTFSNRLQTAIELGHAAGSHER